MSKSNIHQRIAAVMGEVDYIQKEKKQGMNYTIVSHDAVTAKVRPVLLKHGVIYYPVRCEYAHNGNRAECALTVRFANIDSPEDFIDVPTFGYGVDPQDKGPGKAMSYAVKYALLKALGLETGDDADNDSIAHSPVDPHIPPFDAVAEHDTIARRLLGCASLPDLGKVWTDEQATMKRIKETRPDLEKALVAEKDRLKTELQPKDQAA